MIVRKRTYERERQRCADAINWALDWQRRYDDVSEVAYGRAMALQALMRHAEASGFMLAYDAIADEIERSDGATKEVRELAAQEIRMFGGLK